MTVLAQKNISVEEIDAIQSSLPSGQVIRYICPAFGCSNESFENQWFVNVEYYLVVTDNLLGVKHIRRDFVLTPQQIQEKQELENTVHGGSVTKRLASSKKFGKHVTNFQRVYSDLQVWDILIAKYGNELVSKCEVTFSNDFLISDISVQSYQEGPAAPFVARHFNGRGHQIENIGFFESIINGSSEYCHSFFEDIRDIYKHVRDVKIGNHASLSNSNQISKCSNCGSTELTVRGAQLVCDFCQSKFSR
jgi:hypothetical protein